MLENNSKTKLKKYLFMMSLVYQTFTDPTKRNYILFNDELDEFFNNFDKLVLNKAWNMINDLHEVKPGLFFGLFKNSNLFNYLYKAIEEYKKETNNKDNAGKMFSILFSDYPFNVFNVEGRLKITERCYYKSYQIFTEYVYNQIFDYINGNKPLKNCYHNIICKYYNIIPIFDLIFSIRKLKKRIDWNELKLKEKIIRG